MTPTKQPKTGSKSSSHTPGPWLVRERGYIHPSSKSWGLCVYDTKPDVESSLLAHVKDNANARLIAAAPEMYELLSHITNHDPLLPCGFCINEARRIKAEIDGEG